MSKLRFLGYTASMVVMVALSACGAAAPDKPAEDVVREGFINSFNIAKRSVDMTMSMSQTGSQPEESIAASLKLKASGDRTDMSKPLANISISGSATMGSQAPQEVEAELRIKESMAYMMASKVNVGMMMPAETIAPHLNKWWSVAIPAEALTSLQGLSASTEDTAQVAALKEFFKTNNLIKDLKYEKTEKVMGEEAWKYTGSLDKDVLKALFTKMAEVTGQPMDMASFDSAMQEIESFDGAVWVGVDDMTMRGLQFEMNVSPANGPKVTLSVDIKTGDFGKDVTVEVPADAKDIQELQAAMMSAMLGGAAMPPTGDDAMMDMDIDGLPITEGDETTTIDIPAEPVTP